MPEWDELFKEEEFRWREPDEALVALARDLKANPPAGSLPSGQAHDAAACGRIGRRLRVLDLGFGAGRHVAYLARAGFEVCGTDISPRGLAFTQAWLAREGLQADLSDMTVIPFPDAMFDAVVSTYVIHHNTLDNIRRCVAEMHRVLVSGGKALLVVQSKRGYRYGRGTPLEPDTFLPDTGSDAGIPHHFFDEAGVRDLLSAFTILQLEPREGSGESGHRHAHWVVVAKKA
jgi:SAM-dependent methyltransferase